MFDRLTALEDELDVVEARLSDPDVLSDQALLRELSMRHKELVPLVTASRAHRQAVADLSTAREMLPELTGEDRDMVRAEIDGAEATIARLEDEVRLLLLPRDPNDGRNVIVEIRGAEGGEEANLFAKDLYDMYAAYAGRQGWKVELLSSAPTERGGLSDVTAVFRGPRRGRS
jgi:peptide chain release factor 1